MVSSNYKKGVSFDPTLQKDELPKTVENGETSPKGWSKLALKFFGTKAKENLAKHFREVAENNVEVFDDHRLSSQRRHESEIEQLTYRIEERSNQRISITADVETRFIKSCRKIAKEKNYSENLNKIRLSDLIEMQNTIRKERRGKYWSKFMKLLGIRSQSKQLLICLEKAVEIVNLQNGTYNSDHTMNWFYYEDFNVYYTRIESRWPWIRSRTAFSSLSLALFFFLFTPAFFCLIFKDKGVCPAGGTKDFFKTLYFASATMSTVGYGDVTVDKENDLNIFSGIIYMIFCHVFLIVVFAQGASNSNSFFDTFGKTILNWVWGTKKSEKIKKKIRRVTFLRLGQIFLIFVILNFIGVLLSRFFNTRLSWMESIYWSVQTTTTIGYGDLNFQIDDNFRIVLIFYLLLGTYFVGNTLGGLASLKDEVNKMKAFEAWNRREASRGLIDELQPYHRDDKIDQYEFFVASMVILGKVSYEDVVPIMDKFRSLADKSGFIQIDTVEESVHDTEEPQKRRRSLGSLINVVDEYVSKSAEIVRAEEEERAKAESTEKDPRKSWKVSAKSLISSSEISNLTIEGEAKDEITI